MQRYNQKMFFAAIEGSRGNITTIARRVGCDWHTAKKWLQKPKLAIAYQSEHEAGLDTAVSELDLAVERGQAWAIKYKLSTIGKGRGYYPKQHQVVTGDPDEPININVNYVKQKGR